MSSVRGAADAASAPNDGCFAPTLEKGSTVTAPANPAVLSQYPNGMTQPGVFALVPVPGSDNWSAAVSWAHVSKASNLYGASGRVVVDDVIEAYDQYVQGAANGTTTHMVEANDLSLLQLLAKFIHARLATLGFM